jgi:uncharacterized protein
MKLILNSEQIVSNWSSGSTKQIFIYPENASLVDRNFDFRISSAKVEVEESNFSPFEGFNRVLMVLEGQLEINHQDHHSVQLKKFEQDAFSGDWKTSSKGKVIDFNLILKPHLNAELNHFALKKNQTINLENSFSKINGIYVHTGELEISIQDQTIIINSGDCFLFSIERTTCLSKTNN